MSQKVKMIRRECYRSITMRYLPWVSLLLFCFFSIGTELGRDSQVEQNHNHLEKRFYWMNSQYYVTIEILTEIGREDLIEQLMPPPRMENLADGG